MKHKLTFLALGWVLIAFQLTETQAQSFCGSVDLTANNLACADAISPNVNVGQFYNDVIIGERNGIVFDVDFLNSTGRQALEFNGDLSFEQDEFDTWTNVIFGSLSPTPQDVTLSAFENSAITTPLTANVRVGTLTLNNANLGFRINPGTVGLRGGFVETLQVGSGGGANTVGILNLSNASVDVPSETTFSFAAPLGGVPEINALQGDNALRFRADNFESSNLQVRIAPNASLSIEGGTIAPDLAGTLVLERGSELRLSNLAELHLRQDSSDGLARTTLDGARVTFDTGELEVSNPLINDTTIALDRAAFRVLDRTSPFGQAEFTGQNRITFADPGSVFSGSSASTPNGTVRVSEGTTRIESSGSTAAGGLLMNRFIIDRGTLDLTGYTDDSPLQREWLEDISVTNGGNFADRSFNLEALELLTVTNAILSSQSTHGSYASGNGGTLYRFSDATFDIFGSAASPGSFAPTLGTLSLNSQNITFSGDNIARIGIDPNGQCLMLGGACVPGSTVYSGRLNTNVGNGFQTRLTGFDTLTFIPMASDPSATSDTYLTGGAGGNGVYTVSVANSDTALITDGSFGLSAPIGYDALPNVPTLQDLHDRGSTIPANLGYVIVNDPLADNRVDIAFVDRGLVNHPAVVQNYTPHEVTQVITEPTTDNVTTITVTVTPDEAGTASQTTKVVVTEPDGDVISTSNVTIPLDRPTGTTNTTGAANLITDTGVVPTHNGLSALLTSFHPEPYASFMTAGLEQGDMVRNMVLDRAAGLSFSQGGRQAETRTGRRVWLDSGHAQGNVDGENELGGFDYSLANILMGADLLETANGTYGLFAGYGRQSMDEHDMAVQNFTADSYHIGAYGYGNVGAWDVRGMLGYIFSQNEASRFVTSPGLQVRHDADYDSHTLFAGVVARHEPIFSNEFVEISPEVGLGYTLFSQNRATESGPLASALTISPETAQSLMTSIGVEVSFAPINGIRPAGFLRYERDWYAADNDSHNIEAALVSSPGATQNFVGRNRGGNTAMAGLGFASDVASNMEVGGGIVYAVSDHGNEFGLGLNLRIDF